jgi:hypothetical protein
LANASATFSRFYATFSHCLLLLECRVLLYRGLSRVTTQYFWHESDENWRESD